MSAVSGAGTAFHYVCSHDMRDDNPLHVRLVQMWEAVKAETAGSLDVTTMPWGGAGPSQTSLAKLLSGEIAFYPISGTPLSTAIPLAAIEGLPFAFGSEEQACRIFDGELGDILRKEISAKGLVVFPEVWPQGLNQITSSTKPIRAVTDLDGFRLRTVQAPFQLDLFRSLGCNPQPIHYQAVFDSLKSGAVVGQETPYLLIEMDRFVEVQEYLSVTNHRLGNFWLCANGESWNALPQDVRSIVDRNAAKYAELFRKDMLDANRAARDRLQRRLKFNEIEAAPFVARLKDVGFYKRWRKEFGEKAWSALEAQRGPMP